MQRRHFITAAGALALTSGQALAQAPADVADPAPAAPVVPPPLAPPEAGVVRLSMKTGQGEFILDLFKDKAPLTVANFLRYVDTRRYDGSSFFRAMRMEGAPTTGLIQFNPKPIADPQIPPVAHESTLKTGLSHTDGTLSLARFEVGTGKGSVFVCVGDNTYLDAHPDQPGDNAGYAAFGRVVQGMEFARAILAMPTGDDPKIPWMKGQILKPPVPIISVRRKA